MRGNPLLRVGWVVLVYAGLGAWVWVVTNPRNHASIPAATPPAREIAASPVETLP